MKARTLVPTVWGGADLDLPPSSTGLEGSPTRVVRIATPEARAGGTVHRGTAEELASILADILLGRER
jgi:electron transfer flavoprotein alpha/beta subunit